MSRCSSVIFLSAILVACDSNGTDEEDINNLDGLGNQLVQVREATAEECDNGGRVIVVGVDTNDDDALSGEEILSEDVICNGADAALPLIETVTLPFGDDNCPFGGVRIDVGVDANGNTQLDPEEIVEQSYLCDDESGARAFDVPPTGAEGDGFIMVDGGVGNIAPGGAGGGIDIQLNEGSQGGHIQIFKTGVVDAVAPVPQINANLGPNPAVFSEDVTLSALASWQVGGEGGGLEDGEYYINLSNDSIEQWVASSGVSERASGLRIEPGVTVTIPGVGTRINLDFGSDILVEGSLVTGSDLELLGLSVFVTSSGLIDGTQAQGNGLDIELSAEGGSFFGGVPNGVIIVEGTVRSNGADAFGGTGGEGGEGSVIGAGRGGSLEFHSSRGLHVSGQLEVDGGAGDFANGGAGGTVSLVNEVGLLNVHGDLSGEGGDGLEGGPGANVEFISDEIGNALIGGSFRLSGGDSTDGPGGFAGGIEIYLEATELAFNASVEARGGTGSFAGGPGGVFNIASSYGGLQTEVGPGDIWFGGTLDLRGGQGSVGGAGGFFEIDLDSYGFGEQAQITLLGMSKLSANAGSGDLGIGPVLAGGIVLENSKSTVGGMDSYGGGIVNYADLEARGAQISSNSGGAGGFVQFATSTEGSGTSPSIIEVIVNYGRIDVSSAGVGAEGGAVLMLSAEGVTNSGEIFANGTGDSSQVFAGGEGGQVVLYAESGEVSNSGDLWVQGGDGELFGGNGGSVEIAGSVLENSGNVTVDGGDASSTGTGGVGGSIALFSYTVASDSTGDYSASGGSGGQPGQEGSVIVDGVSVDP